ncbi:MAG: ABC transporter permease [Spirochaetia bacterium]|nr:ABC transporter permease [Spirochaetia bacterium]
MILILLGDLFWLAVFTLSVYTVFRILKHSSLSDAVDSMKKKRRVRIAFYVICIYFLIGFVDQLKIPGTGTTTEFSPIDFFFQTYIEKERTYSAPWAKRVTGISEENLHEEINLVKGLHLLGTDVNGYDVFYTIFKGAGTALILSFGTSIIAFPLGVALGILAGFFGGWVDDLIQWLYTTVASIPWLLFVIAFLMVFGRELYWICLAFGLTSWVGIARLVRGETLKIKQLDYILAAKATGIPVLRILYKHLLPNVTYLIIINFTLFSSNVILAESVLTFIGIGVQPGTASWGVMLVEAQQELTRSPAIWWIFAGGSFVGILPLVLSLNLFGDALRDALDPRLRGQN